MDEEENANLCIAAIVVRKRTHSLILVLLVFARFIIKTMLVIVQSHQSLTFPSSLLMCGQFLHVTYGNISISTWTYTQKHKHNHVFKCLLFD